MNATNFTDDRFVDIPLHTGSIDLYVNRTAIKNAIIQNKDIFNGRLLDIGCGKMPYKDFIFQISNVGEYIGLDIEDALEYETNIKPDFTWDGKTMPFNNEEFDSAFGTEVLEHCPMPEMILNEIYRVLKPGGAFFFTVPFLWPLHEVPHDEYRYTPFALSRLLKNAGFSGVQLQATGGWHASLAQMLGLWVRRAPLTARKKKYFSWILLPIIKRLLKWERYSNSEFKESQMITGLSGIAYKPK